MPWFYGLSPNHSAAKRVLHITQRWTSRCNIAEDGEQTLYTEVYATPILSSPVLRGVGVCVCVRFRTTRPIGLRAAVKNRKQLLVSKGSPSERPKHQSVTLLIIWQLCRERTTTLYVVAPFFLFFLTTKHSWLLTTFFSEIPIPHPKTDFGGN